ncbi:hypothetical protein AN4734.2 [Aspergillus nidulans FGSC A4]|nr:hypothetical protein AN4734.2 [Aspergillus nidulans FGSC A4]|eukprot:XP_662338.1 hypothetical protein AN4734.2 [Aspergillus nidulans FGSC A4]
MAAVSIAMKSPTQSPDSITELLWKDALRHLGSTNDEVLLPTNVVDIIGQDNVEKIKSRLSALLGAPVVSFVDESINALRVLRTPTFSGSSISVASPSRALDSWPSEPPNKPRPASMKPAKIPRPPNAFILYRQHHYPKVKEARPDLSNNEISEEFKKKHAEEYPDYQYTPRKPSEKKRRAASRISPKNSKRTVALENPGSMTAPSSNVFTPQMYPGIQNGQLAGAGYIGYLDGLNSMVNTGGLTDEPTNFGTNAFNSLFQQPQSDYGRTALFPQLEFAGPSLGDSLEFPEFAADYF